jgi:hypothetical protein
MSVRNGVGLFIALSTLALLVGCGGSGSPKPVPPPSGAFSNSDLNGTYVFSSTGVDANGDFLAMTGTVAANGSGSISGGTVDIIGEEIDLLSPVAQPITSGSYNITADGRGQISFNTTTGNSSGSPTRVTFTLDLVLTTSSHGLVTEYDSNGTGSGTIDLQTPVSQTQIAGPYTFGLTGAGTTGSPLAMVGSMTLGATGSVTTGLQDINNDGAYTGVAGLSTSSFVNLTSTPGTAVIESNSGTFGFDVYPIDSTHLKFIESDGAFLLSGDAYTQATSIPSGQLVYTMAGEDVSGGPIDVGGWLTNMSGTITAGLEDFNDALTVNQATISGGSFSALSGGRSTLNLTGFVNGAASDLAGNYTFAAYPFTYSGGTGIQLLEIDDLGITSGAAYPQSSVTLASPPQGYGFNLSGVNPNGEEDDIAEFTTTSSGFSGIADLNDDTTLSTGKALSATYVAPDGNGRGSATTNYWEFNFYVVNPTTYILLETDTSQVGQGTFEQQSNSSGGTVQSLASILRPAVRQHSALKRRKN